MDATTPTGGSSAGDHDGPAESSPTSVQLYFDDVAWTVVDELAVSCLRDGGSVIYHASGDVSFVPASMTPANRRGRVFVYRSGGSAREPYRRF